MKYVLPHMVDAGGGSIINQAVDRRVGRDAGWSGVLRSQGRSDSNDARRGA